MMSRQGKFALLAAALGIGATALGFMSHQLWRATAVSMPATTTEFALPDLTGKTHRLADYRGKTVVLNFWATWCPPCRREIPGFINLQKRYQNRGLQIVGISIDNPEAVARYWQEMKINYPLLLADDSVYGLMAAYGNSQGGLPYSVLIGPDGRVAATRIGVYEEKELETLLLRLFSATG